MLNLVNCPMGAKGKPIRVVPYKPESDKVARIEIVARQTGSIVVMARMTVVVEMAVLKIKVVTLVPMAAIMVVVNRMTPILLNHVTSSVSTG